MAKIRDLSRTKDTLQRAALAEFSAKGMAGARTDAIARRAGVTKRMLFYCFGSKEDLYREVMRGKLMERAAFAERLPDDLGEALLHIYDVACGDLEWVRMLEWEALIGGRTLVSKKDRQAFFAITLSRFDRFREEGIIPGGVDPVQLFLSFLAVTVFPLAFPQIVRMATGCSPLDRRFVEARRKFLKWLGARLQNRKRQSESATTAAARRPRRDANASGRART